MRLALQGFRHTASGILNRLFEKLPESGPSRIQGYLETKLAYAGGDKVADLLLVIDTASAEQKRTPRQTPESQTS